MFGIKEQWQQGLDMTRERFQVMTQEVMIMFCVQEYKCNLLCTVCRKWWFVTC